MTWKPEDDNQYIEEQELGIRGMNERHTPGPWNVSQNHSWNIMAESGMVGSACFRGYQANELEKAEVEANARLIAAAPELLEACINLVNLVNEFAFAHQVREEEAADWCKEARTAIAKATGKQPSPESKATEIVRPERS